MTMYELALEYAESAALVRARIRELKTAKQLATTSAEESALAIRIAELESIYKSTADVERYLRLRYLGVQYRRGKRACYAQKK